MFSIIETLSKCFTSYEFTTLGSVFSLIVLKLFPFQLRELFISYCESNNLSAVLDVNRLLRFIEIPTLTDIRKSKYLFLALSTLKYIRLL